MDNEFNQLEIGHISRNGAYRAIGEVVYKSLKPLNMRSYIYTIDPYTKCPTYNTVGDYVYFSGFGCVRAYHLRKIAAFADIFEFLPTEEGLLIAYDNTTFTLNWQGVDGKGNIYEWRLQ